MSRAATGDVVRVRPSANIYTALAAAAAIAQVIAMVIVFFRAKALGINFF